jgi:hypothetical protein
MTARKSDVETKLSADGQAIPASAGYACSLACWVCGKTVEIEVFAPPQFAFEVAGWAKDIGWVGVLDIDHGRSLVFCSNDCCEKAKTKRGAFRARPPRHNVPHHPRQPGTEAGNK